MPVALNEKGEAVRLDESGQWVPTKTAKNPQTGETLALDGQNWLGIEKRSGGAFAYVDNVVRQLAKGATFGGMDDLEAAIDTVGGGGSFEDNLASATARDKEFEAENPIVSTGAQIVGGIGGALTLGAGAGATRAGAAGLKALAKLPRPVQGVVIGGGAGAAAGAGFSEGGVEERLTDAATGAGLGASLGIAAPVVFGLIGQFGKRAIRPILDRIGKGPSNAALRKTLEALDRDKITPEQALAKIKELGDEAALVDVGPNVSAAGEAAANRPGVALERATDLFTTRRGGQVDRILKIFDDSIGPPGQHVIERIEESPAFRRALEQSIDVNDDLIRLMQRPSIKQAWEKARGLAGEENKSLPPLDVFIARVKSGDIVKVKTQVMHWLKKGLDDVLEPNRDPVTGFVSSKVGQNQTFAMNETRRAFRGVVKDRNPDYAASLDRIATGKRLEDAYKTGFEFSKIKTPKDVEKILGRLDELQTRAFRRGVRDSFENKIRGPGELNFDVTRTVLGQGPKIQAAFGKQGDDLIQGLKNERVLSQTEGRVLGNSRTSFRQAAGEDLGIDPSLATSAARGDVAGFTGGLLRSGFKKLSGPPQAVADELGGVLFNQGAAGNALTVSQLSRNAGSKLLRTNLLRDIEHSLAVAGGQQSSARGSTKLPR